jgi:hypothetical protein
MYHQFAIPFVLGFANTPRIDSIHPGELPSTWFSTDLDGMKIMFREWTCVGEMKMTGVMELLQCDTVVEQILDRSH